MRSLVLLLCLALAGCLSPAPAPGGSGPAEAPAPEGEGWPALEEAFLRPGVKAPGCTTNFLFRSPDNATLYLGSAAHCFGGARLGDRVLLGASKNIDLGREGVEATLAYCSWATLQDSDTCPEVTNNGILLDQDPVLANDFALLEIDADDRHLAHPAVLHWGGPTGLYDALPAAGDTVLTYGNSGGRDADQGTDEPLDPRQGLVRQADALRTRTVFAPASISGDSGSPVLLGDGAALGVMQTLEGDNGVVNLRPLLEFLHAETDLRVELVTWAVLERPVGVGTATG